MLEILKRKVKNNIWKFTVHSITNKRTYMTFLSIYLLTMPGATERFIGILTGIGQIAGFLLEIPSGYISDKIGHKNALVIARFFMVLSTACYVLADSKIWFVFGAIFLAVGFAFVSGTGSAFMHDTLNTLDKKDQYSKIMGKVKSIGFAIPIVFILLLARIADLDFKLAFTIALSVDLIGLFSVLLLKQPTVEKESVQEIGISNFKKTIKEWLNIGWFKYILITSLVLGISMGATMGFKNTYQELVGFSITMIGVLWATSRLLISATLLINGHVYKKLSFRQFILLRTTIYSLSFLALGLVSNMWLIALFFILPNIFNWGLGSASSQYHLDFISHSKSKATLLSVNQLIQNIFTGIFGIFAGFLVMDYSYKTAYLVSGIIFTLIALISVFYLKPNAYKNRQQKIL